MAKRGDKTVDLERENAELRRQLAESLAQQTATAEVQQVINASPGDLAPVFNVILEKAHSLCGADFGSLVSFDGEFLRSAAERNLPPAWADFVRGPTPLGGPDHPATRLMRGEPFLHIEDLAELARTATDPMPRAGVELAGIRTLLLVPLRKDGVFFGYITAFRQEVRPFTEKQIALLQNFAAQAVIAMENARLITETREALEQQTATAEVLGVINSSPGDLKPVFDAMLDKAIRLCDAVEGVLWTIDGERGRVAAAHGLPTDFVASLKERGQSGTNPLLERVMRGEHLIHVPDTMQFELYGLDPLGKAALEAGVRTLIWVALVKNNAAVGAFAIGRREVRPFADKQIALLQNFAAQAVIAMENARLITETQEALEQQTATAEVLGVINSSPGDLAPVFNAMLEKAISLCEATFGTLWTYDGDNMHAAAVLGATPQYTDFLRAGSHRPSPIAHQPLIGGAPVVHIADVSAHEGYQTGFALPHALVELGGVRTLLAVPLRKDKALLGVFSIYRDEVRSFTDKQIALLQNFAAQAVIAIENARLITETREALDQQTATAEILAVISNSLTDTQPVFDAIVQSGLRLFPDAAISVALSVEDQVHAVAVAESDAGRAEAWRRRFPFPLTREYMHSAAILDKEVIDIPDVRDAPIEFAAGSRNFLASGYRGITIVPMRRGDTAIGALSVVRRAPGPLSAEQLAVLQTFANQAVIAIENARLITETREALDQQTATAEVLQVINSSPGDLAPVFDAILEKARSLCGAAFGTLMARDGALFRALSLHQVPEGFAALLRQGFEPHPNSSIGRLVCGETLIHVPDLAEYAPMVPDDPVPRTAVEIGGVRTLLMVPLRKDETVLGVITAFRREVRPFTDKQIALLQNFAAQAVIAMENARLLGELRQRTDEVAELNRGLEARVAEQVDELGRVGNLKRFLPPQVAEMVVSQGDERILESHRREIVVVFCDVRGYTAFSETAEPEEVIEFLGEYHAALGPLITRFEGTLSHFLGDGLMVFFNDPVPCPDPAERAVKMAVAMREAAGGLVAAWRRRGHQMGFGAGVAQGYATLGQIGFADRSDYTAIGTVCNLAARLCGEAQDGQILLARRVAVAVEAALCWRSWDRCRSRV